MWPLPQPQPLYPDGNKGIPEVFFVILLGMRDEDSPLHLLRGLELDIFRPIFRQIKDFYQSQLVHATEYDVRGVESVVPVFALSEPARWPKSKGRYCNMMPFIMNKKSSLPKEFHCYWELIEATNTTYTDAVGYLTIDERTVTKGESHRRPGLHTERPGHIVTAFTEVIPVFWGRGSWVGYPEGGIYMASNVENSCEVYNVLVEDPSSCVAEHGDAEHMRFALPDAKRGIMKKDTIYWITDRTPHASLPLPEDTHRQYFRLVTSEITHWFEEHSTANPLCKLPENVIVVTGSKFKSHV